MNRFDQIQSVARDIASNVHQDPAARNAMADDLIKLCGLMIAAVGKSVAIAGESATNEAHGDEFWLDTESISYSDEEVASLEAEFERDKELVVAQSHGMYITGERIQDAASATVTESTGADLERYEEGPHGRAVWQHTDRRPGGVRLVDGISTIPTLMDASQRLDLSAAESQHTWVTATDGEGKSLGHQHCGVCGVKKCDASCGDVSVGAAPDVDCPTHGDNIARQCNGEDERCPGCGERKDNGESHGVGNGYGGCV